MNIGLIGSGGREHAICKKLYESKLVNNIFCFPGNAGTSYLATNIEVDILDYKVICVYVPNGNPINTEKFAYKLEWLKKLLAYAKNLTKKSENIILLGDFNIAPTDQDVHDPEIWQDKILVSPEERSRYQSICALGMVDTYRMIHPDSPGFSWWDYRQAGWRRDRGLRIDCVFVSEHLRPACQTADVHRLTRGGDRPSDHAPVTIELIND